MISHSHSLLDQFLGFLNLLGNAFWDVIAELMATFDGLDGRNLK